MYRFAVVAFACCLCSCDKANPTGPSGGGGTRILAISGDLNFGPVPAATLAQRAYIVTNSGTETLTITSVTAPAGFVSTLRSTTLFSGQSQTVHVLFSPTAATVYGGNVTIASDKTSGPSTIAVGGTGTVAAGLVPQVFSASISGGDPHCFTGLGQFAFDVGACQVFPITVATTGRIDALLTYNGDDALLTLQLYQPSTGDVIASGDLTFDPYPGNGEHGTLSANISAGAYQLRVRVLSSSKITTATVATTHP